MDDKPDQPRPDPLPSPAEGGLSILGSPNVSRSTPVNTPVYETPEHLPASDAPTVALRGEPAPPEPPAIPGYEIAQPIGRGGMGIVYLARETRLDRPVALKMLRGPQALGAEGLARFRREARALAQADHPHVVPVYASGEHDGQPYFTMKYMGGGNLQACKKTFPDDPHAAVVLMEKVARAVAFLHARKILHRDLKPLNILLDEHGEPHVSDFGLAKLLDGDVELTRPETMLGTLPYMAPEQLNGPANAVTTRADVWALGVMLYELLAGSRPFTSNDRDELAGLIRDRQPPPLRSVRPGLPRGLDAIVDTCLARDLTDRYPTADALADDLGRWLRGEWVRPRRGAWVGRLARNARRYLAPIVAVAAAAGLGFGLLEWFRPDPDRPLRDAWAALDRGDEVTFIGDSGMPAWSQPLLDGVAPNGRQKAGRPLTLETFSRGLLQLMPALPRTTYTLHAEVGHEASITAGEAGIYLGLAETETPDGRVCGFVAVTVHDPDQSPAKEPRLTIRYHARPCDRNTRLGPGGKADLAAPFPLPPRAAGSPPRVHALEIDVTPEAIRLYCNGQVAASASVAGITERARAFARKKYPTAVVGPAIDFTGGWGLYLESSTTTFRNVRARGIPSEQATGP